MTIDRSCQLLLLFYQSIDFHISVLLSIDFSVELSIVLSLDFPLLFALFQVFLAEDIRFLSFESFEL